MLHAAAVCNGMGIYLRANFCMSCFPQAFSGSVCINGTSVIEVIYMQP
jgi:hypothetical protein